MQTKQTIFNKMFVDMNSKRNNVFTVG